MTEINTDLPDGATPIEPDDLEDLIPEHIETRSELNEFEAYNINAGTRGLLTRALPHRSVLDLTFCIDLHRKMTDKTWRWAGQIRTREVNIGNCPPYLIRERLIDRLDSTVFWVDNGTYQADEICARLHRDLVWIHPFINVNGRHSRIMADLLARSLRLHPFTWGSGQLIDNGPNRDLYLDSLRQADQGNYGPLIAFMRS